MRMAGMSGGNSFTIILLHPLFSSLWKTSGRAAIENSRPSIRSSNFLAETPQRPNSFLSSSRSTISRILGGDMSRFRTLASHCDLFALQLLRPINLQLRERRVRKIHRVVRYYAALFCHHPSHHLVAAGAGFLSIALSQ